MNTYEIQISELLYRKVSVETNSESEALNIISDQYYNGEIVLNADDYVDGSVQFEVINTKTN